MEFLVTDWLFYNVLFGYAGAAFGMAKCFACHRNNSFLAWWAEHKYVLVVNLLTIPMLMGSTSILLNTGQFEHWSSGFAVGIFCEAAVSIANRNRSTFTGKLE